MEGSRKSGNAEGVVSVTDSFSQLHQAVRGFDSQIPDSLIAQLYEICLEKTINKGEFFIMAGEISEYMGLNVSGLFRYFYVDRNGRDLTKGFSNPGKFLVSYSAIVQRRPSAFSIEALRDGKILQFPFRRFSQMMDQDIRWYPFAFRLLESVYIMKELREKAFLLDDASTRYMEFKKHFAGVEDQIKLYHVASYLGITPETLSRIRNRV
jgi:CRP-like cAMP-binding protein